MAAINSNSYLVSSFGEILGNLPEGKVKEADAWLKAKEKRSPLPFNDFEKVSDPNGVTYYRPKGSFVDFEFITNINGIYRNKAAMECLYLQHPEQFTRIAKDFYSEAKDIPYNSNLAQSSSSKIKRNICVLKFLEGFRESTTKSITMAMDSYSPGEESEIHLSFLVRSFAERDGIEDIKGKINHLKSFRFAIYDYANAYK